MPSLFILRARAQLLWRVATTSFRGLGRLSRQRRCSVSALRAPGDRCDRSRRNRGPTFIFTPPAFPARSGPTRSELAIRCVSNRVSKSIEIQRLCRNFDPRHARRKGRRHEIPKGGRGSNGIAMDRKSEGFPNRGSLRFFSGLLGSDTKRHNFRTRPQFGSEAVCHHFGNAVRFALR